MKKKSENWSVNKAPDPPKPPQKPIKYYYSKINNDVLLDKSYNINLNDVLAIEGESLQNDHLKDIVIYIYPEQSSYYDSIDLKVSIIKRKLLEVPDSIHTKQEEEYNKQLIEYEDKIKNFQQEMQAYQAWKVSEEIKQLQDLLSTKQKYYDNLTANLAKNNNEST
jgi:gas vesicle protein